MSKVPFIVVCTSCESVLEVRNSELVGQIVACPKCGSMVLIEQTSQVRHSPQQTSQIPPTLQAADVALPEESLDSVLSSQIPDASRSQNTTYSVPISTSPDEFADEVIDKASVEFAGEFVGEEQLGEVASELQVKFLSNRASDDWQKRRLMIVAVGTICLLTLCVAFFMLRLQSHDVASTGTEPVNTENRNDPPQVPTGIEATRTGGQPDNQPLDIPPSHEDGQNGIPLLPSADDIKVEDQTAEGELPTDTNDNQDDNIAGQSAEPTPTEPSPTPDRQGIIVRVPISPEELSNDDPFGDLFDNIDVDVDVDIDNVNINNEEGNDLDVTPSRQPGVPDGFAGYIEENAISTDPIGQETNPDVTLPDISETSEEKEDENETVDFKEIDINERLAVAVTAIRFDRAPIIDVVRALSDISGVPMQLDVDELRVRNLSMESPVSLQFRETRDATTAEIIDAVLQKTRLTRHDGNGWLAFGFTDEQVNTLRTARYDMSQLASLEQNPISAKQAADWLSELLVNQPHPPKVLDATVAVDGNEIVVVGTIWLQDQAKRLLQSLFYLRGLEPENGISPERLAPEVFGWDRVNVPLSFNLVEPMALKQAAGLIERYTRLRILIDHAALHAEGLTQASQVTSRVSNGTIDTVLRGMLEPLGLTYRIVEANAVEITTPQAARQKMTIEPHLFAPLADGQTPDSCAEALRQAFIDSIIVIDPVSGYMLVRQSQPLQRDIRLWFGLRHTEPGESGTLRP